jgi:uncharacterized protein
VSWIHNTDAARVFVYVLNNENINGPVNAVAPNPVRMKEFAELLGDVMNRPSLLTIPKIPFRAVLEEASVPVTEGIKVYPEKLMKNDFAFDFTDLRSALLNLL